MPRVVGVLHQLLEVVRQPNYIELDQAVEHVDARRVHIPMYNAPFVQRGNCAYQLPKN